MCESGHFESLRLQCVLCQLLLLNFSGQFSQTGVVGLQPDDFGQ